MNIRLTMSLKEKNTFNYGLSVNNLRKFEVTNTNQNENPTYFIENNKNYTRAIYNEKNKAFYYKFVYIEKKKQTNTEYLKNFLLIRFKKLEELKKIIENLSFSKEDIKYKNVQYGFYFLRKLIKSENYKNKSDFQDLNKLIKKKNRSFFNYTPYKFESNKLFYNINLKKEENKLELTKYTYFFDIFNDVDISPVKKISFLSTPRLPFSQERDLQNIKKILDNILCILKCFQKLIIEKNKLGLNHTKIIYFISFLNYFKFEIDMFFSDNKRYKESETISSSKLKNAEEQSENNFYVGNKSYTIEEMYRLLYPQISNTRNGYNLTTEGGKKSLKKDIKEKKKPKSIKKSKKIINKIK